MNYMMATCVTHKVPIIITSLGAREDINAAAHSYGGVVLLTSSTTSMRTRGRLPL